MIRILRSMTSKQKEAVVDISVIIACAAFLAGWIGCGIVKGSAEEANRFEKVTFCHAMMKDGRTLYWWRQEYCGKALDAVDPISGKPVAGIIEGE